MKNMKNSILTTETNNQQIKLLYHPFQNCHSK